MIFVDTCAFISKYIESDQYHNMASRIWGKSIDKAKLYTSNHIIDETITFLMRKTTPGFAIEKAKILYHTEVIKILRTDIEDELYAVRVLEKYKEHDISFTDCLTVALMKRHNIDNIFSFDDHFKFFNFRIVR